MTEIYPELDTPALVVYLDVLEQNIGEMADFARREGVDLRPHIKTHKCPDIALMQIRAGASGITVAKLGEAEVMADAGIDDMLIAYPLWGEMKLARLRNLMERASVQVGLDSVEVAEPLGRLANDLGRKIPVMVEVDTGHHRLGRPPGEPSASLALEIAQVSGIEVLGLMTHPGHAYERRRWDSFSSLAERAVADLVETADMCSRRGLPMRVISIGSTVTDRYAARLPGVSEIRPGSYVFCDVQHARMGVATPDTCAARVLVTVVSRPARDRFVIDAGTKAFTSDGDDRTPFPGRGVVVGRPDLTLEFLNEEHGVGRVEGVRRLDIGDRLEVIPLHACGATNMFDSAFGVRDGIVERELEIAGRGRLR